MFQPIKDQENISLETESDISSKYKLPKTIINILDKPDLLTYSLPKKNIIPNINKIYSRLVLAENKISTQLKNITSISGNIIIHTNDINFIKSRLDNNENLINDISSSLTNYATIQQLNNIITNGNSNSQGIIDISGSIGPTGPQGIQGQKGDNGTSWILD